MKSYEMLSDGTIRLREVAIKIILYINPFLIETFYKNCKEA